jgi:hypothetical protein
MAAAGLVLLDGVRWRGVRVPGDPSPKSESKGDP